MVSGNRFRCTNETRVDGPCQDESFGFQEDSWRWQLCNTEVYFVRVPL